MSITCPEKDTLVEERIDRVATQYRESGLLLFVMRTYLGQVAEALRATCAIPSFFDIETAVGDQLTLLGKRLGFPRRHCICATQPVVGFACEGVPSEYVLAGACEPNATFVDCGVGGFAEIEIADDEVYRGLLLARRYQALGLYDLASLTAAIRHLWGATAIVLDAGAGRVVVAPGRDLTADETALLQIYPRVLPVAPGIRIRFHLGDLTNAVAGFGEGWGHTCSVEFPDGLALTTADGTEITTEDGTPIFAGPLTRGADLMCPIDPKSYDCA